MGNILKLPKAAEISVIVVLCIIGAIGLVILAYKGYKQLQLTTHFQHATEVKNHVNDAFDDTEGGKKHRRRRKK